MSNLYYKVRYKYCPGCGRKNKHTDKYCTVCRWWLGKVEIVEVDLYEECRQFNEEKRRKEKNEKDKNMLSASSYVVKQRQNYKYTADEYNKDMFWYNFLNNFWVVLIIIFFIAPVFNGGWILQVLVGFIALYSLYKAAVVDDKYDSNRW